MIATSGFEIDDNWNYTAVICAPSSTSVYPIYAIASGWPNFEEPKKPARKPPFYRGVVALNAPLIPKPISIRLAPLKWKPVMGRKTINRN